MADRRFEMRRRLRETTDIIDVVLDDAAVDRLRSVAEARGIEVEQLIVSLLHAASERIAAGEHLDGVVGPPQTAIRRPIPSSD